MESSDRQAYAVCGMEFDTELFWKYHELGDLRCLTLRQKANIEIKNLRMIGVEADSKGLLLPRFGIPVSKVSQERLSFIGYSTLDIQSSAVCGRMSTIKNVNVQELNVIKFPPKLLGTEYKCLRSFSEERDEYLCELAKIQSANGQEYRPVDLVSSVHPRVRDWLANIFGVPLKALTSIHVDAVLRAVNKYDPLDIEEDRTLPDLIRSLRVSVRNGELLQTYVKDVVDRVTHLFSELIPLRWLTNNMTLTKECAEAVCSLLPRPYSERIYKRYVHQVLDQKNKLYRSFQGFLEVLADASFGDVRVYKERFGGKMKTNVWKTENVLDASEGKRSVGVVIDIAMVTKKDAKDSDPGKRKAGLLKKEVAIENSDECQLQNCLPVVSVKETELAKEVEYADQEVKRTANAETCAKVLGAVKNELVESKVNSAKKFSGAERRAIEAVIDKVIAAEKETEAVSNIEEGIIVMNTAEAKGETNDHVAKKDKKAPEQIMFRMPLICNGNRVVISEGKNSDRLDEEQASHCSHVGRIMRILNSFLERSESLGGRELADIEEEVNQTKNNDSQPENSVAIQSKLEKESSFMDQYSFILGSFALADCESKWPCMVFEEFLRTKPKVKIKRRFLEMFLTKDDTESKYCCESSIGDSKMEHEMMKEWCKRIPKKSRGGKSRLMARAIWIRELRVSLWHVPKSAMKSRFIRERFYILSFYILSYVCTSQQSTDANS